MPILSWLNRLCSAVDPAEQTNSQEPSLFEEGVVVESIEPGGKGRVKLYGVYWSARSSMSLQWSIPVDTPITVQGRRGLTLIVEPLTDSSPVLSMASFQKRSAELGYSCVSGCHIQEQRTQHMEIET